MATRCQVNQDGMQRIPEQIGDAKSLKRETAGITDSNKAMRAQHKYSVV